MGSTAVVFYLRVVLGFGSFSVSYRGECLEVLCVIIWFFNLEGVGKVFLLMKSWK